MSIARNHSEKDLTSFSTYVCEKIRFYSCLTKNSSIVYEVRTIVRVIVDVVLVTTTVRWDLHHYHYRLEGRPLVCSRFFRFRWFDRPVRSLLESSVRDRRDSAMVAESVLTLSSLLSNIGSKIVCRAGRFRGRSQPPGTVS